ncbi:GGDEF domain-containing protein [Alkalilimnicola sp. S0819]|uniref:GGDEF domain-containing protein n=1 Tax=Alkalilimnicola sp. S0819 TaxID=2613922 RepID=UPI0012616745|nr:diguanylate cyclase [Alkalilimnicola sp. S0819]KAB7623896.1 diguanylate cyclase [Alkalilimnicola sp. S0819]MPQ16491.1 diguanylate cyclase [Alkalilimnicola sp. S0819]
MIVRQFPASSRPQDTASALATRLSLATRLHESLEPCAVLEQFFAELRTTLAIASLEWRDGAGGEAMTLGLAENCLLVHSLEDEFGELGELTVSRGYGFSEAEQLRLELAIDVLRPALRNALMYRAAMQGTRVNPRSGLGNRLALEEALFLQLDALRRHDQALSLVVLDCEDLALVESDAALAQAAERLAQYTRGSDQLFQESAGRFLVLMPHTPAAGAVRAAERLGLQLQARTAHAEAEPGDTPATLLARVLNARQRNGAARNAA